MCKKAIKASLSDFTVRLKCSASTQRQALNAIVFSYNRVLDLHIEGSF